MKKTNDFFGMIALIMGVMLVFSLIGCDNGNGNGPIGGNPQTVTYTGTANSVTYTLKVTENTARYTVQSGDAYELTAGSKKSTGTVSIVTSGVLTLTPSNSSTTFTATVSGTSITAMTGTITWDSGTTENAPNFTGVGDNDDYEFTITGYSPSQTMDGVWTDLYASTRPDFTLHADLISQVNYEIVWNGFIAGDGSVEWNIKIPNGSYTLYLRKGMAQPTLMKTPSPVTITNGNGTVAFSTFVDVPPDTGDEGGEPASFEGTWRYSAGQYSAYTFVFNADNTWSYGNIGGPIYNYASNECTYTVNGNTATLNYKPSISTTATAYATIGANGTLTSTLDNATMFTFTKQQ